MSDATRWKKLESCGEGGQGQAFVVCRSDGTDPVRYVYKRLRNAKRNARFDLEIAALRRLEHPNIVQIIDDGDENGKPFYVMELCGRGDLSTLDLEPLSLRERLALFRQVCLGVAAAHQKGLIHRDLKPKNVLVRTDGSLAVGDFGLCLDLSELDHRNTETGEAVGPRDYICPELEGGRAEIPAPSCDCYALGKLLYYFVSGKTVPRERYREGRYDLLRDGADSGMHFVYDLLDRSLTENPEGRFKDGGEFLKAVDGVLEKFDMEAHVLDLEVVQKCLYCVDGNYRLQLLHEPKAYAPRLPDDKTPFRFWGSNSMDQKPWMALVCDNCGHVQFFRRDLTKDVTKWKNVK